MMGRFTYYARRVSKAHPAEILYRLKWKARSDTYDRLIKSRKKGVGYFTKKDYSRAYSDFFDRKYSCLLPAGLRDKYAFDREEAIREADRIVDGVLDIFDVQVQTDSIVWNKDYKNDKRYPNRFATDFYHEDPRYGMVRYVWELNRQYQVVKLGKAYLLTGDERYAKHALGMIDSWIEQNPYLYSINWFSPLELSVRGINWIWCLGFLRGSKALDKKRFTGILDNLYLHAISVAANISKYSSANNHLMGELAFLRIISAVFPHFRESPKWEEMSEKGLDEEIFNQVHEDGVGAEQCTNYLMFSLNLFIDAMMIAKGRMPRKYHQRLLNSQKFLKSLMQNRESLLEIGDSDYASIPVVSGQERRAPETVNAILQICGKSPYGRSEYAFWLTGQVADKSRKEDEPKSVFFNKGGYLVSVNKDASLIFDCGPVGYLSTAGHGHCDMLSFILSVKGKDFFVDPGTYVYHGNRRWRDYFKSTAAHNTVMVEGREQSEILGNFIYGRKARCKVLRQSVGKQRDTISAVHDGFAPKAYHKRTLVHDKENRTIRLEDKIKGGKYFVLFFNCHPDVSYRMESNSLSLSRGSVEIVLNLENSLETRFFKGSESPIAGWYSPMFGVKLPCLTIMARSSKSPVHSIISY